MTVPLREARRRPPGRTRRVAVVCGLVLLLVAVAGASALVRERLPVVTTADLDRIDEAVRDGCDLPGEPLRESTEFALDGTVERVSARTAGGPILLALQVNEWFVGPPVDRVEVYVDPATARHVTGQGGVRVEQGARLLVSGTGWDLYGRVPTATGCGRTRAWDQQTADAWREGLPVAARVEPDGPLARYASAGFLWTGPEGSPSLRGVLVRDSGCLYLQDGATRWLPVFPTGVTRWAERDRRLLLGGELLDVSHHVRLGGLPASGVAPDALPRAGGDGQAPRLLDEGGLPSGCDPRSPRFVVAEPLATAHPGVTAVPEDSELLATLAGAARQAGMEPGEATGEIVRGGYGDFTVRLEVMTRDGPLVVHSETVAYLAWPSAFRTSDARFRWSLDPEHAAGLPAMPKNWQLVVLERDDGTQVLLRTPERIVVSVSTDGPADRWDVADLVAVGKAVAALTPGDDGS
jgi:hypothetical protein